jgi:glutaredoxin 3
MVVLRAEESGFSFGDITASLQEKFQTSARIVQESQKEGAGITQILANVLAGEYDQETVQAQVKEMIRSAPMVMLTWERSPSCVNAIKAMDASGFEYSTIRLDDPWDAGNPIRAEVGKMVGRSSVPMVFIGGEYVGGYDGGLDTVGAPGLVELAFKGELQSKLEEAGAKRKTSVLTEA